MASLANTHVPMFKKIGIPSPHKSINISYSQGRHVFFPGMGEPPVAFPWRCQRWSTPSVRRVWSSPGRTRGQSDSGRTVAMEISIDR
jgi:hypothetical protein